MRKKEQRFIITFQSTIEAMDMEEICKENGIRGRLIPVPRQISANCGMAFSALPSEKEEVLAFIEENNITYEAWYELEL